MSLTVLQVGIKSWEFLLAFIFVVQLVNFPNYIIQYWKIEKYFGNFPFSIFTCFQDMYIKQPFTNNKRSRL